MKTLSTVLNVVGIVLDVAIAIMSIITIRHILATRKEKQSKLRKGMKLW